MAKEYFVDPLPQQQRQQFGPLKDQLLSALALTAEREEQWLRNEALALGVDDLAEATVLLGRTPSRSLVTAFHRRNPEVNLKALDKVPASDLALKLLSVVGNG